MKKVVGKVTEGLRDRYSVFPGADAFAIGFAVGQAEKVYLGACRACMFRPSAENFVWYKYRVQEIAGAYGLVVTVLESGCPETPWELWLHREGADVGSWVSHGANTPSWHMLRAEACGIPIQEVDFQYHLRGGYGENCDGEGLK